MDADVRTDTDFAWSYDGEVNRDVDPSFDKSEVISYTKGKFSGPLSDIVFTANPYIELRGTQAPAVGEVLDSDNGVGDITG